MFVVTLPAAAAGNPLAFAELAKAAGADILELRGDLTPQLKPFASPLPLLFTPRSKAWTRQASPMDASRELCHAPSEGGLVCFVDAAATSFANSANDDSIDSATNFASDNSTTNFARPANNDSANATNTAPTNANASPANAPATNATNNSIDSANDSINAASPANDSANANDSINSATNAASDNSATSFASDSIDSAATNSASPTNTNNNNTNTNNNAPANANSPSSPAPNNPPNNPPRPPNSAAKASAVRVLWRGLRPAYVDLELGEFALLPSGVPLIRSFHDHAKTPCTAKLLEIYEACKAAGASFVKLATYLNSYADVRRLEALRDALDGGAKVSIMGMGPRAHCTRIVPRRNFFNYTYLERFGPSAEGQISLEHYHRMPRGSHPKRFGIIGGLKTRSLSPLLHSMLFKLHKINALYIPLLSDTPEDVFAFCLQEHFAGLSITAPFKRAALTHLDRLDASAKRAQAANTAVLQNGTYAGFACDAQGFQKAYKFLPPNASVAILGSGGVLSSLLKACTLLKLQPPRIFARNANARTRLAREFSVETHALDALAAFSPQVLICAISEDVHVPLPKAGQGACAIDLRYGKKTRFALSAETMGFEVHDGLELLLQQAAEQFRLFVGTLPAEPALREVRTALRTAAAQRNATPPATQRS